MAENLRETVDTIVDDFFGRLLGDEVTRGVFEGKTEEDMARIKRGVGDVAMLGLSGHQFTEQDLEGLGDAHDRAGVTETIYDRAMYVHFPAAFEAHGAHDELARLTPIVPVARPYVARA